MAGNKGLSQPGFNWDQEEPMELIEPPTAAEPTRSTALPSFTLADQIRRDLETLRMTHIPFPGREFFEERIAAYREAAIAEAATAERDAP